MSSVVIYKDQASEAYGETDEITPYKEIYSMSKFLLENLAAFYREKYDLPVSVFRLSNIYGPGQNWERFPNLIPQLFHQALVAKKIEVWNLNPVRDFTFITDAATAISKELNTKESGLYNLGTGVGVKVGEVVDIIAKLAQVEVVNLNKEVSPPFRVVCDTTRLEKHLGFVPTTTIQEGLQKTFEYYQTLV